MSNVYEFDECQAMEEQAVEWLIKMDRDEGLDRQEQDQLNAWLAKSSVHRDELKRIAAFSAGANVLTELAVPLHKTRPWYAFIQHYLTFQRSAVFAAIGLFAIGLMLIPLWQQYTIMASNGVYVTAVGQQLSNTLSDGSTVLVNTNSKVQVDYGNGVRKIHLLKGEAHFDVTPDPDRPFEVYAGDGRIRAVGTAFTVYVKPDGVKVTVTEGKVDLSAINKTVDKIEGNAQIVSTQSRKLGSLDAGQSATFDKVIAELNDMSVLEINQQLAWRKGLLEFNGEPLSQVVAEVNRYTQYNIQIMDETIGSLAIGGRFKVGELELLFDVLTNSFGLQVSRLDSQLIQIESVKEL